MRIAGLTLVGGDMAVDAAIYAVGWLVGWVLLWQTRPLPRSPAASRRAVTVIIPARDEARVLPGLLGALRRQLRTGDQLVVVDDISGDDTASVAEEHGALVVTAPAPPEGWLGKPHACWYGAQGATTPILVFVDADVSVGPCLIDDVASAVDENPDDIVSVQPWHATGSSGEQASILFNVVTLMGSGAFTPWGDRVDPGVAFGAVLALRREVYNRVGGHAAPTVRAMHTEDIALARAVGRPHLFTGRPDTTYRMYPNGLGETFQGWTRTIATGARSGRWWWTLLTVIWIFSLAGGWLAVPLAYPLSALQFWLLGRRAGAVHWITALLYPVATAVFVAVFLWSLLLTVTRRDVTWKGRRVAAG